MTPEKGLCPDWIYSDYSNVHVAKDRVWFTSYHAFPTHFTSIYNIGPSISAICTIKLSVKSTPGSFTIYGASTIELHNVLHVSDHLSNLLGRPLADVCQINLGGSVHDGGPPSRGGLALHGKQITHYQSGPNSFFPLAVLPPPGTSFFPSSFRNGASRMVSVHWLNEERGRWQAVQSRAVIERDASRYEPPYVVHEMNIVKKRWGSEIRFLAQYGLKLRGEMNRSKGRRIARALMRGRDAKEMLERKSGVEKTPGDHLLPGRGNGV